MDEGTLVLTIRVKDLYALRIEAHVEVRLLHDGVLYESDFESLSRAGLWRWVRQEQARHV